jgi:Domain of unknown function (DUF1996)
VKRLLRAVLVAVFLLGLAGIAYAAPAAIFTNRVTGQRAFVDPVVSPGQPSSHEHSFYGAGPTVTPDTDTSDEFRALPTTWVETDNHTGFWIPTLYEDGQPVPPSTKHGLFYYQPVSGTEQVPPEGTKGVTHEVGYRCGFGGGTITNLPPSSCSSGEFVISGFFRASRDFGLTQPFPKIRFFLRFNTGPTLGRLTIGSPDGGLPGAVTMDDIHADYFFGWDRAAFERFLVRCVRPGTACGTDPNV